MAELFALLLELAIHRPIVSVVLLALLLWVLCVAVMGKVLGTVLTLATGLLIFAVLRRSSKQRLTTLGL